MRAADFLPDRFNAAEWFVGRHVAQRRGNRTAIRTDSGEVTFAELDEDVRCFAAVLARAGIHAGDRVAFILPDIPFFSVAFWGALAAGAVAVPLNTLLKPANLRSIVADCDPRALVFDPEVVDGTLVGGEGCLLWSTEEAARSVRAIEAASRYAVTHRDGIAFLLYSSATTGQPKGVVHLQHDMWICCRTYGEHILRTRPEGRCFSVAKLFFAYGLGNAQYFPYDAGACAVLYSGRPTPEAVFEQVRRHRPTLFFGVPTAYAQMLAALDRGTAADFSSVRQCASAGEALPASLFERWREKTGLEILDGVGSTEACHMFASNRPDSVRPGSSGLPVPGYDLKIANEAGDTAATGEIGDLLVRGDSTMAFYWNRHEATKKTLRGEWIATATSTGATRRTSTGTRGEATTC